MPSSLDGLERASSKLKGATVEVLVEIGAARRMMTGGATRP